MASYTEKMDGALDDFLSAAKTIVETGSSVAKSAAAGYSAVKSAISPSVPVQDGSQSQSDFEKYFKKLQGTNYTPYLIAGGAALLLILLLKGGRQPYGVVYSR